jgi:CO/xanthine dehydrogenase FAD-binding subunit
LSGIIDHAPHLEEAARLLQETIRPVDDLRATKEYRSAMAVVIFKRALSTAAARFESRMRQA